MDTGLEWPNVHSWVLSHRGSKGASERAHLGPQKGLSGGPIAQDRLKRGSFGALFLSAIPIGESSK